MKYRIYGKVSGSKYLGEIEADSHEEAIEKGWKLDTCYCSVCHQCSKNLQDPEIEEIYVEKINA